MSSGLSSNAPSATPSLICQRCGAHPYAPGVSACSECGASELTMIRSGEAGPGVRLGDRYILLEQLGRGGFGSVYRAAHTTLGGVVAVKVLHVDAKNHPSALKRFYSEAKNSARLSHPHNIRVFDFGHTNDDVAFIAMDLIDGAPLSDLALPIPATRAVRIVDQVAAALGEAHTLGLVHRDLKPPNIMLSQVDGDDFVRVLDYGISKLVDSTSDLTNTGGFVGSPDYAAPEQLNNTARSTDVRTDVYALGVVLFQLLCGRCPFIADDPLHVLYMHRHEAAPRLSSLVSVSPELDALVATCLEKDPQRRPRTMAQLRTGLQSVPEYAEAAGLKVGSGTLGAVSTPSHDATLLNTDVMSVDGRPSFETQQELARDTTQEFDAPSRRVLPATIALGAALVIAALASMALLGDPEEANEQVPAERVEEAMPSSESVAQPAAALTPSPVNVADDALDDVAEAMHQARDATDAALSAAASRSEVAASQVEQEPEAAEPDVEIRQEPRRAEREPEPDRAEAPSRVAEVEDPEPQAEPEAASEGEPAVDARARLRERARQRAIEAAGGD